MGTDMNTTSTASHPDMQGRAPKRLIGLGLGLGYAAIAAVLIFLTLKNFQFGVNVRDALNIAKEQCAKLAIPAAAHELKVKGKPPLENLRVTDLRVQRVSREDSTIHCDATVVADIGTEPYQIATVFGIFADDMKTESVLAQLNIAPIRK